MPRDPTNAAEAGEGGGTVGATAPVAAPRRSWIPSGELAALRVVFRPWAVRRYFAANAEPRLHLGCGRRVVPGWLNADRFSPLSDIWMNATSDFPFRDGVFRAVYSEHMVEHLPIRHVRRFLSESHRVLAVGGCLRLTCPDLARYAAAYVAKDDAFFAEVRRSISGRLQRFPDRFWPVRGRGGAFVSGVVRAFHHHQWMYDFETLSELLGEVGFSRVVPQSVGVSVDAGCAGMDDPARAFETLYVDALK